MRYTHVLSALVMLSLHVPAYGTYGMEYIYQSKPAHPISCLIGIINGMGIGSIQTVCIIQTLSNLDVYGVHGENIWGVGYRAGNRYYYEQSLGAYVAGLICTEITNILWHDYGIDIWKRLLNRLNSRALKHGYTYGRLLQSLTMLFTTHIDTPLDSQVMSHVSYAELGALSNTLYHTT